MFLVFSLHIYHCVVCACQQAGQVRTAEEMIYASRPTSRTNAPDESGRGSHHRKHNILQLLTSNLDTKTVCLSGYEHFLTKHSFDFIIFTTTMIFVTGPYGHTDMSKVKRKCIL